MSLVFIASHYIPNMESFQWSGEGGFQPPKHILDLIPNLPYASKIDSIIQEEPYVVRQPARCKKKVFSYPLPEPIIALP